MSSSSSAEPNVPLMQHFLREALLAYCPDCLSFETRPSDMALLESLLCFVRENDIPVFDNIHIRILQYEE